MPEILSVAIPTRNRANYLKELLLSLRDNLKEVGAPWPVKVYVFDNASDDETGETVRNAGMEISYQRHAANMGGDANILHAYGAAPGEYVWVIGDDELVPPGTIKYLLEMIKRYRPGLLINRSAEYVTFADLPVCFDAYSQFIQYCLEHNPHLLIAHSLISANIIRRDCFDRQAAETNKPYYYGHFYGIALGLKKNAAPVVYAQRDTLLVRRARARGIDQYTVANIINNQLRYLGWLAKEYDLKGMDPMGILTTYGRRLARHNWLRHPFGSLCAAGLNLYSRLSSRFPRLRRLQSAIKRRFDRDPGGK